MWFVYISLHDLKREKKRGASRSDRLNSGQNWAKNALRSANGDGSLAKPESDAAWAQEKTEHKPALTCAV